MPDSLTFSHDKLPTLLLELIYALKVRDVMNPHVHTAERKDSMKKIQLIMKENKISGVPVVEHGYLVGIVSVDDIIKVLDNGLTHDPVEAHMSRNIITLEDEMPLSIGLSYMEKYRFGRFPVLNKDDKLVGIVTRRDILNKLLIEMNKEVERIEQQLPAPENIEVLDVYKKYFISKFDFENAGKSTSEIKRILQGRGLDSKLVRRVAIASYELEVNLTIHSLGGTLTMALEDGNISIIAQDVGPGIKDVDQAMQEGFSTASDWIRSLGFGAGMGLPNVKRVSDDFQIRSEYGKGTYIKAVIAVGAMPEVKE